MKTEEIVKLMEGIGSHQAQEVCEWLGNNVDFCALRRAYWKTMVHDWLYYMCHYVEDEGFCKAVDLYVDYQDRKGEEKLFEGIQDMISWARHDDEFVLTKAHGYEGEVDEYDFWIGWDS